uniref:Uncharacterized protein n=1 Tax=Tetradesmus obliquus TaxID=3088 RepID=A0A383WFZ9_TETOB|eukprot:jgi/Sobl393_1/7262/SZX76468.1
MPQLQASTAAQAILFCAPACRISSLFLQELVHQHSIFKLLFQALSRSLHLLLRATSKEKKQAMLLKACTELQMLLSAYVEGWHCSMLNMPQQETAAEKQLARQQLQETDLLQTFSAACERDTTWLQQQLQLQHTRQQRQQQQAQ